MDKNVELWRWTTDECRICPAAAELAVDSFCHVVSAVWKGVQQWCSAIGRHFEKDFLIVLLRGCHKRELRHQFGHFVGKEVHLWAVWL